ncbi:MAG: LacI family DNA-binding transcriptional regulator [Anaerolineae bacterium]|nr:LacI family DNA-binding transcriptional regulator [Anaerolineae bacterium]
MMSKSSNHSKRVTIKDVAQAAGVSVTTVSNALNQRTEAMTQETLQRIQEAIQALNYRPSSVARSLVTNQTATIGLIISEIETPLFLQALSVIEPAVRAAEYSLIYCTARSLDDEQQAVNLLLEKRVDGIIFLSTSVYLDDDYLLDLLPTAPPIVIINRTISHTEFDQIHWDNTNGTINAIDHLVEQGHQHIAFMRGPDTRRSSEERYNGYQMALKKHGLPYRDEYVVTGDYETTAPDWERATLDLLALSPRPTAILASNDIVASVVLRTVQRAGLRIPADISIIGNDNQPFSAYSNPALTTVEAPVIESGRRAIAMLLKRMGSSNADVQHVTLPCPLILRESSGPV